MEAEIVASSKGNVANADNVFQWNLIDGLDKCLGRPVSLLNCINVGSYPKRYKRLFIPSFAFSHADGANDYNVGFCNLTGYKRHSRNSATKKHVKRWAKDGKNDKVLIAYAMYESPMLALRTAKLANPDVKTCLIVPDLPQFLSTTTKQSLAYKILKRFRKKKDLYAELKYVDSYVVLTEQMLEKLGNKPHAVVEGVSSDVFSGIERTVPEKKTVVYAGSLALKYGIGALLEAFSLIEGEDYRLIVCGRGDAEALVKEYCERDDRITYAGILPRSEVLKAYRSASVLVNPRKNEGEYTKYSFPSKIMEYLSSGVSAVAFKLDGIPDEYDQYINYVDGNAPEDFAKAIKTACDDEDGSHARRAESAREFVLKEKSSVVQAQKIVDLLKIR